MNLGVPLRNVAAAVLLCLPWTGLGAAGAPAPPPVAAPLQVRLGLTVEPLDTAIANHMGLPPKTQGLVVTSLAFKGPAATAGLRIGDIVQALDGRTLTGAKGVKALADHRGPAQLTVLRAGVTSAVTVG